ncbi:MAG: DUF4255 domain-containing protein [Actinobacteria bacterium]|nr:DUF4255 domain-containing protein [Actinomycetota bacterium]
MRDLSIVTDTLRQLLTDALTASPVFGGGPPPFSVTVTGQHPETPSGTSDCELSLYLFHVGPDKFLGNSFWTQAAQSGGGTGRQPVAFEPLCLDLWYMLSAQSQASYVQEQQVLGIAMQAFHEHATVKLPTPTPLPGAVTPSEVTLTLESPTFDELSRLWQALGLPLRTTAQYRVSVVFLTPPELPPPAPPVTAVNLAAAPSDPPADASLPRLLATRRTVGYLAPGPANRIVQQSPASTAPAPNGVPGQVVELAGELLADTDRVLLVSYDPAGAATETDVTGWKVPVNPPYPAPPARGVPFLLRPPAGTATPAGRYQLVVTRPSVPGWRSNPVPVAVAAWVDPSGGPLLHAAGNGVYTMAVRNVAHTGARLRLGTVELSRIAAGADPDPGEWQCSGGSLITFVPPADLPAGTHQIGLRVGDVEADPALWAVV